MFLTFLLSYQTKRFLNIHVKNDLAKIIFAVAYLSHAVANLTLAVANLTLAVANLTLAVAKMSFWSLIKRFIAITIIRKPLFSIVETWRAVFLLAAFMTHPGPSLKQIGNIMIGLKYVLSSDLFQGGGGKIRLPLFALCHDEIC
jgi:hypothetical protein